MSGAVLSCPVWQQEIKGRLCISVDGQRVARISTETVDGAKLPFVGRGMPPRFALSDYRPICNARLVTLRPFIDEVLMSRCFFFVFKYVVERCSLFPRFTSNLLSRSSFARWRVIAQRNIHRSNESCTSTKFYHYLYFIKFICMFLIRIIVSFGLALNLL